MAGSGTATPWDQMGLCAGIALVAVLPMTIVPSRQVGNVMSMEALRYEGATRCAS